MNSESLKQLRQKRDALLLSKRHKLQELVSLQKQQELSKLNKSVEIKESLPKIKKL